MKMSRLLLAGLSAFWAPQLSRLRRMRLPPTKGSMDRRHPIRVTGRRPARNMVPRRETNTVRHRRDNMVRRPKANIAAPDHAGTIVCRLSRR
jgi:hypothetical protein